MRMLIYIYFCFFIQPVLSEEITPIEHYNGARITRTEYYDGSSLWGYINGGADVYLEYGFEKVLVQEFNFAGNTIKMDVYRMDSPEAAFGIFSVRRFNCLDGDSLNTLPDYTIHCHTKYNLQLCSGRDYISITNSTGKTEDLDLCFGLAGEYLALNMPEEEKYNIYKNFPDTVRQYFTEGKLMKGALGLQNGKPDWIDYFDGIDEFEITLLNNPKPDFYINLAFIQFKNAEALEAFLKNAGIEERDKLNGFIGMYKIVKTASPLSLYYMESGNLKSLGRIFDDCFKE